MSLQPANAEQAEYWNGPGGRHWTERQEMQDALLAPVSAIALKAARSKAGERVLDIGCGCGDTSLALAQSVGPLGHVLGLDLSEAMLARARERAPAHARVAFAAGDATGYGFAPGAADLLFSRFGVMFFADPTRSFANMRLGLKPAGRVVFACWREAKLNPWLGLPLRAAVKHVPRLPDLGPEDPGPFSFADLGRVRRILEGAGFGGFAATPHDLELDVAGGKGLEGALASALEIGPASRALEGQPEPLRAAATQSIREALAPHLVGDKVPLGAAIWIVEATNG